MKTLSFITAAFASERAKSPLSDDIDYKIRPYCAFCGTFTPYLVAEWVAHELRGGTLDTWYTHTPLCDKHKKHAELGHYCSGPYCAWFGHA